MEDIVGVDLDVGDVSMIVGWLYDCGKLSSWGGEDEDSSS